MQRRALIAVLQAPLLLTVTACKQSGSSLAEVTSPQATSPQVLYTPDNGAISYSDHFSVSVSSAAARFSRPLADIFGQDSVNPGARARFSTNSANVSIRLQYTDRFNAQSIYNGVGCVLVDGALHKRFSRADGLAGPLVVDLDFDRIVSRDIEVVMPYGASVDLAGIAVDEDSVVAAASPRSVIRCGFYGDSITQGNSASEIDKGWPYLLAAAKDWQLTNGGYAGYACIPSTASRLALIPVDVATYLIGFNDFVLQTSIDNFRANIIGWIGNYRLLRPGIKIYCITPTYSPQSNAITLEDYRQAIRDALIVLDDPLNILIEGLGLASNDALHFPDDVHPSDSAAVQIAGRLASQIEV